MISKVLNNRTETERLKILTETSDGFEISEVDFKLRGQGEIFGNKQSGDVNFKLANIKKDFKMINQVKKDVIELFENKLYTDELNEYLDLIDIETIIS